MKKLVYMTLVAAMALTLGACNAKKESANSEVASTEAAAREESTEIASTEIPGEPETDQSKKETKMGDDGIHGKEI